jgi:formylglycine-generating enzyme required for sulfatase activity
MDEADPASISGFRLDKYLVTVGRFRAFANAWKNGSGFMPSAGSGKHPHLNGGKGLANAVAGGGFEPGWLTSDNGQITPTDTNLTLPCDPYSTWTSSAANREDLPVNCVNWYEAYAFCIWDGGFLPSEAEWEYAAAGGGRQREYPWGTAAPGTANRYAIYGCFYPSGSGTCTSVSNIAPVGTATQGASLWGQLDMAGEVWQWNLDFYADYVNPCTDCYYMAATTVGRSLRGASYVSVASYLPPAGRSGDDPSSRTTNYGFRCARAP